MSTDSKSDPQSAPKSRMGSVRRPTMRPGGAAFSRFATLTGSTIGALRWSRRISAPLGQDVRELGILGIGSRGTLPPAIARVSCIRITFAHGGGQALQVFREDLIGIGRRQRNANLPEDSAFGQGKCLAFRECHDMGRLNERNARHRDPVLGV